METQAITSYSNSKRTINYFIIAFFISSLVFLISKVGVYTMANNILNWQNM